jgi:hypothetical protein
MANKEDDPQYMMNRAKKEIIMATLEAKGGKCILGFFGVLTPRFL